MIINDSGDSNGYRSLRESVYSKGESHKGTPKPGSNVTAAATIQLPKPAFLPNTIAPLTAMPIKKPQIASSGPKLPIKILLVTLAIPNGRTRKGKL